MRVLVVHASRHGATQGIAERIAATLHRLGLEITVEPVEHADPESYDAVVIGSAAYYFHWLKKSTEFVRRNRTVLANRPVWLISSGPLGTDAKDAQGRDLRAVTEPKEIAEFREGIHPRDHRVFFGALNRNKLGFVHGLVLKMFASSGNKGLAEGDFRDWNEIDAWACSIAQALISADRTALSHVSQPGALVSQ